MQRIVYIPYTSLQTQSERLTRGGSRNFGKGGPVRGRSPEPNAEGASAGGGLPRKF